MKKAKTARSFNMDSGEIGKLSQPGGALYNIEHSNNGLISFPGDSVENDHAVAAAGAAAIA